MTADNGVYPQRKETMQTLETVTPELVTLAGGSWVGIVDLTPDAARLLLGCNTRNRHVRPETVGRYKEAILDGRWQISPDAIAVENGILVNGQHRCHAVAETGLSVPALLAVNIGTAFDITDNGASRSAGDILFLAGLTDYPGSLATATKLYLKECGVHGRILGDNRYIEQWVLANPTIEAWNSWAQELRREDDTLLTKELAVPAAVQGFAVEWAQDHPTEDNGKPDKNIKVGSAYLGDPVPDLDEYRSFGVQLLTGSAEVGGAIAGLRTIYQQRLDRIGTVRGLRSFTAPERLALISYTLLRHMAGQPGVSKLGSHDLIWHWRRDLSR